MKRIFASLSLVLVLTVTAFAHPTLMSNADSGSCCGQSCCPGNCC